MKKQSRNTRGPGAWVLGGVASLLMCVSAFGQYVATQSTPIAIPDSGTGTPYPSSIDLTKSNIIGVIEKVSVTVSGLTHPSAPDLGFLLVGPNSKAVVLLSGSGASSSGNASLNNATFTFSDDATGGAPANSPLVSGSSYKPTDNAGLSFLPPAPTSGYITKLGDAFASTDPNGIWKLYVLDTTAGPGGGPSPVVGSWSLNLNTTPTFTIVTNASTVESATHQITTTVPENGSVGVGLVLQSSSTPVANLTVSATKIPTLVTNFSTSGTDQNRTLTITPNATTFGTNTLVIKVDDGIGSVTTNITLAVTHTNQAPTIALSTNTVTTVSGFMTTNIVIATVADADINFDPASVANLNLTATSSDPSIVSSNGVFFSLFTAGGDKRTVTVIPNGTGTGTATLTIKVDDGALTNSATLTVTVLPVSNKTFANSSTISAPAAGSGNSTIVIPANTVAGLVGSASIFVNGWKNVTPASTTFTLTPPGGTPITLFANTGSSSARNYGQVFFVDGVAGTLPSSDDVTNTISLAPPSQIGGTNGALSGVNPNGTWTLTVQNNGAIAAQILDGWTLNLFAAPVVGSIADVRAAEESTSIVNFTVGSINGSVTNVFGRINANPALAKITGSVNGNNASLTIVGNFNQFGTNIVEVVGQDNNGFYGTNTFTLALFFVNHAPTIDVIQRQVVAAGAVLGPIPVTVRDVDTLSNGISSVTVRANSSDQKFLPDANILLLPAGTGTATSSNYTLTLFPVGAISGNVNVTITANDGLLNGTTTFNLTIQPPGWPLFVSANAITVNANGPGSPYGSTNNVSGLIGKVQKVSVSLFGINVPTPGNAKFLLVGPTGASVLLMSGSGGTSGSTGLTNTALVFDDASTVSLPSSSQIISGVYKPTQNGTTSLPPPAPASPYGGDFSGFNGTNPNGNWALYVADTGSAKGGIISGGWQLSIQTSPSIPAIADQSTPENVTARISVTVGDNQPGVGLNVVATGDPTLFVAPIAVSGSGATRTLTIVPVPFKVGTNVITVTATDTNTTKSSQQTFNMAVQAVAQPPLFVTTPADQTVPAATQLPPVSFQVWPPQGSPLTLTASSTDNPTLIPSANIDISQTGTINGTTNIYSLTLIPAGVLTGTGTVSIVATDTNGLKSTANFKVIVTTSLAFANTNTIIIPEGLPAVGVATPYPSLVSVKGLGGLISEAKVTLVGFTHSHPEDVDILLVSPDRSKSVMLMGKAGSGGPVSDLRLNFADGSPAIPALGPLVDGTYSAADYSSGVTLPSPATVRPYTTTLSSFNGLSPNGDWQLYVLDDTFPSGGSINNGWVLSLKTAPAIAPIGPVTTSENTQVIVPVLLSDATVNETNLVVTVAHSLESVPDLATNLVLTGTGANLTLTITPTTNLPSAYNAQHSLTNLAGTNVITITAKDPINNLTTVSSFVLKVLYVNQSPTVVTATNGVYVDENSFTNIAYTVGDVDSIMDRSNIVVTSSDQSLLANSNIVVTGNALAAGATGTINVKVTPTKNTHGSLTLSFVASDTNSFTTNLVTLNINHIWQQPTISAIPAQSAVAGSSTTNIAFTVGSVEVSTKNLTVFAKSDNPAIVPNSPANIVFSGSGDSRFIQLFTIGSASGTATITVFVTDNSGNASSTNSTNFALTATSVANSFANTNAITTAGAGKANIYPSPITVSGLLGGTYKVSVTLPNFSHSSPANLDVLLVGNKTNAVVLMSGVGGTNAASNLRLVFAESGVPLPSDSLSSATYLPGNATGSKLVLPSPAPTNTIWSATLSAAFAGKDANGLWELYVNDRGAGDVGNIANGWQLVVQTAPTIALAAGTPSPLVFPENTTTNVTLNIGDIAIDISNLVVSATSDNAVLLPVRNITFAGTPSGHSGTVTATLAPAALQNGSANVNFIVTRSDGATSSVKLPISVTPVNVPSTVSRLDPISMPENGSNNVVFLVHDDDTPLGNLIVQATTGAGDQGLIPNANLSFNGLNTNRLVGLPSSGAPGTSLLSLGITPKLFQAGTATVTITVTDPGPAGTNTITTNFTVTVNAVIFPPFFIIVPGPQSVAAGGTIANIPFAIAHPVDAASTLTMSGTSSDQNLVKNTDIVFGGTGTNRTVSVTSQNTSGGTATITLKVTDPATANNFATTNFALTVRPSRTHNYTNSTIIHIIDNAVADLYPSQININNLGGPVAKITATLNGFTHTFPSDVGVLLVGPTGQKIVLMSNVGGGHPGATNLFLTFDQAASGTIPANGPIVQGSFTPLDNSGGLRTFQSPAPGTPYTNTLNAFNGTNGNGTWSLYVEDFSPPDAGAISNGWSLGITTLPTISGLTDITVKEDTAAVQNFTVSDDTPSTPTFTFSAASDNQSVVTNAGVVFTGSGTNWTVTVNPVLHASGSANITVTMVNGDGQTVTSKFKATFTPVNYPPDLFPIQSQTIAAGTAASVPVNYGNIGYSQSWLTVTFGSSNTNLVPVGNMKLSGTNLLISPVGVQQGTSSITVTVANTNTPPQSTNQTFKLTVGPNPLPVFAASGTIVINDNAAATPYPSTIHVSGVGTNIAAVTVSLVGFGHQFPSDVSVLLVGPQGQKVVLMSRAGTSFPITNTRLNIDDSAPAAMPQFAMITDGTYKPTDYKVSDTFFAPAPLAPYSHALNVFNGSNPNGDWQLFVQDDQPQESGVITGGWVLAITTSGPSISNPGPTTIVENSVSNIINFSVSSPTVNASNLIVTATNTADSPKGIISSLTVGGSGSSRFLVVTPGLNLPSLVTTNDGTSTITLTVSDGSATNSASFPLTVSYVNQPPTMNPPVLQDLTTPANVPISTSFSLADVDTPVSNLVVSATTTVPGLGTATVSTVGSNSTVAYAPKGFVGTNIVKITVQDGGNTISNGFVVVTTASLPPTLAAIAPQSTPGAPTNSTKSVTLNVSPATGIPGFTFSGTTTNHALVSSVTFTTNANSVVANLNIVGAMVGFDFVTITVSDKNTNSTKSFPLTVTPTGVVTLAPIAAQSTPFNVAKQVLLTASSPDTAVNNLHFTGSSTNSFLVSGFSFAYNGRNMIATINLATNRAGIDFITISTTDGFSTASQSFVLTVTGKPPGQTPVLFLSISGGKLTLSLQQGSANTNYTIQGTSSLKPPITWGTITNLTSDANGNASFTATPSPSVPVQFIRAKSP